VDIVFRIPFYQTFSLSTLDLASVFRCMAARILRKVQKNCEGEFDEKIKGQDHMSFELGLLSVSLYI
jgi:hypothetical protein